MARKALADLGVSANDVRKSIELMVGRGDRPIAGTLSLTPRAQSVLALAGEEAGRLRHQYIGTEHLLIGVLLESEGLAANILNSLGVTLDAVRHQVIAVLNQ